MRVTDEMICAAWNALDLALAGRLDGTEYAYGDHTPMKHALEQVFALSRAAGQEAVAWCATDETGTVVEALGMNQSRRFDTPLYLAPPTTSAEVGLDASLASIIPCRCFDEVARRLCLDRGICSRTYALAATSGLRGTGENT